MADMETSKSDPEPQGDDGYDWFDSVTGAADGGTAPATAPASIPSTEPAQKTDEPAGQGDAGPGPVTSEPDEQLLADAVAVGFSPDEAIAMPREHLERAVRVALRNVAFQGSGDQGPELPPTDPGEPPPVDLSDMDPDEYDPKLMSKLDALAKRTAWLEQQALEAKQVASSVAMTEQDRLVQRRSEKLDQVINSVGRNDLFGEGSYLDLQDNKQALANRQRFATRLANEAQMDQMMGRKSDLKDLANRALRIEFDINGQSPGTKTIIQRVNQRNAMMVPRGTRDLRSQPKSADALAHEAIARAMGKNTPTSTNNGVEDAEFLTMFPA